jgi:chemotaxis protein MotA
VDPMTLIGIAAVLITIVVSTIIDGNSFGPLSGPSSFLLVFVGTLGAVLAGYRLRDARKLIDGIKVAFTHVPPEPDAVVIR